MCLIQKLSESGAGWPEKRACQGTGFTMVAARVDPEEVAAALELILSQAPASGQRFFSLPQPSDVITAWVLSSLS